MAIFITFGEYSCKMWYPLFMGLFFVFSKLSNQEIITSKDKNNSVNPLFIVLIATVSESFAFFIYLIQNCFYNRAREAVKQNSPQNNTLFNALEIFPKKNKLKIVGIILLLTFFDWIKSFIILDFRENYIGFEEILKGNALFFTVLFSWIFLSYEYHRHHYIGLTIFACGMILYFLIEFFFSNNNSFRSEIVYGIWIYIVAPLSYSIWVAIQECTENYLMKTKYISPFILLSFEGIFGTLCVALVCIILYLLNVCDMDFLRDEEICRYKAFYELNVKQIVFSIAYSFFILGFNVFRVWTNYYFSPSHRNIADSVGYCWFWITNIFLNKSTRWNQKLYYSWWGWGHFIILFGTSVYLEMIILQFCKIDKYTQRSIRLRGNSEINKIIDKWDVKPPEDSAETLLEEESNQSNIPSQSDSEYSAIKHD